MLPYSNITELEITPSTLTFVYTTHSYTDYLTIRVTIKVGGEFRDGKMACVVLVFIAVAASAILLFIFSLMLRLCLARNEVIEVGDITTPGEEDCHRRFRNIMSLGTVECVYVQQSEKAEDQPKGNRYGQTQCVVCLAEFEANKPVRKLACSHIFHPGCIECWVKSAVKSKGGPARCPICNVSLTGRSKRHAARRNQQSNVSRTQLAPQ